MSTTFIATIVQKKGSEAGLDRLKQELYELTYDQELTRLPENCAVCPESDVLDRNK